MDLPHELDTARLHLRRPAPEDAAAILARFAADPEVTRYMGWRRHRTLADTREFLDASARAWEAQGAGAYLLLARSDGRIVGTTGLHVESLHGASTGYAIARDAWGQGYATEAARAMAELAWAVPALRRLQALCHAENARSVRVLEKAGFEREGVLRKYLVFPNSGSLEPADVLMYARVR